MRFICWASLFGLLLGVMPTAGVAQQGQQEFGRNRIQYSNLDWQYYTSNNFDVYYHQSGNAMAQMAAQMAEQEFNRITNLIGYTPYTRTRIYLYDSPARLAESNVGLDQQGSILGGKTSFIKNIVEVAYPGTQDEFRKHLARGMAKAMIYDMMYGGSFTEAVQNSYLMMLPEWFTEGAILYVAEGNTVAMDNFLRSAALDNDLKRLAASRGERAAVLGQSIWAYIADKYNRSSISNILNLTRIIRNEENAIASTLGVGFNRLLREWRNFSQAEATRTLENYREPTEKDMVRGLKLAKGSIHAMALSPDGQAMVYTVNRYGRTHLMYSRLDGRGRKALWVLGQRQDDDRYSTEIPLSFVGNDKVALVRQRKGKAQLVIVSTNGFTAKGLMPHVVERTNLEGIDQVREIKYSVDGSKAVLSASADGQSDIYLYAGGRLRALTNDEADDINPILSPKGGQVFYASNPPRDSLQAVNRTKGIFPSYGIYRVAVNAGKQKPVAVVQREGNVVRPSFMEGNRLLAVSDEYGIANYLVVNADTTTRMISNLATGLVLSDYSTQARRGLGLVYLNGRYQFTRSDSLSIAQPIAPVSTSWREAHPVRPINEYKALEPQASDVTPQTDITATQAPLAPVPTENIKPIAPQDSQRANSSNPTVSDEIDIRNYVFESEKPGNRNSAAPATNAQAPAVAFQSPGINNSGLSTQGTFPSVPRIVSGRRDLQQKETGVPLAIINGPFYYRNKLSAGNAVTTFNIDPLRGWGALAEVTMTDLFDNHLFHVKALPFLDLRSSVIGLDYEYLKNRIDFGVGFERNTLFQANQQSISRNAIFKYSGMVSYPITEAARVVVRPYYMQTNYIRLGEATSSAAEVNDKIRSYAAVSGEFVFDNSITSSSNITTGSKLRVYGEYNASVRKASRSFGRFYVDARRYQRLHKEITLAVRGSAGHFFGPAAKQFILGGMDNWLFQQIEDNTDRDPLDPVYGNTGAYSREGYTEKLLNQFVTTLRGFNYNAAYGNSYMLLNVELRVPLVRYLYKGPITSNFLRNLQFTAFYDAGSAWSGAPVWTRRSTANSTTVSRPPIEVTVRTFRDPFLYGYGVGMRTLILGYYAKFDVAWGQSNRLVRDPKFYLTIGHDF